MDKVVLTRSGYDKLTEELQFLKTKKRREIAGHLEVARAHGDLRENAEYDAAKNAKLQLEKRIATLEMKLSSAKIVEAGDVPQDKAYLGAQLELKNIDTGENVRYTLVAQDEADFEQGKISVTSPIGRGLLGKAVKEKVVIEIPAGKINFEILGIQYG